MKFSLTHSLFSKEQNLPWLCAMAGSLLAWYVIYQAQGTINSDGIRYIEVARLFSEGLWREGLATYNWPLYSLLIFLVHEISGLQFQAAANLLSVLFFGATCLGLATLIRETGGDKKTVVAGLALLASSPYLVGVGGVLPMVMRDHGYWTFYIWGVVYFLRFMSDGAWRNAIYWGVLAIVMVLFRVEGLIYLVMLPLVLLTNGTTSLVERMRCLLKANVVPLTLALLLVLALIAHPALQLKDLGRLQDPLIVARLVYEQLAHGLSSRAGLIGQSFGPDLDSYAMTILLLGMGYILLAKAATVGGLFQTVIALGFWKQTRQIMSPARFRLFIWLLALSLANAAVIMTRGFVVPKRILSPIAFIVIVFAAYGIAYLIGKARENKNAARNPWKWAFAVIAVVLSVRAAIALEPSDPEMRYEINAARWVIAKAGGTNGVYLHSDRMRFYAGLPMKRQEDWETIRQNRWKGKIGVGSPASPVPESFMDTIDHSQFGVNDYLVFTLDRRMAGEKAVLEKLLGQPIKVFDGPRGSQALVYQGLNSPRAKDS